MSKISVIVPVYKVEEYLTRCVDSILAQTHTSFDLILVDDGSPDDCGKICDDYAKKDARITVIHQENQGLSMARNAGIEWALKNSNSEWITFIDSDDWIHKDYLKVLYETTVKYDVDLSICNCIKTSDFDVEIKNVEAKVTLFAPEDFWCFRRYVGAWAKLYRKNHFKSIRYPEGLLYEDIFVTYRLLFMQPKVAYIENALYFYFLRDDSITQKKWTPKVLSQINGVKQQLKFFKNQNYHKAFDTTVKVYLMVIMKQLDAIKKSEKIYIREYIKLWFLYRINLIRYCKKIPITKHINMYRYAFPKFTKLYKKYIHLKEKLHNGR
ncbi:MAG: glycosyltransferase [Clostridia bacterium]|nr:glycosyltransferase [Clostridia bacterium]